MADYESSSVTGWITRYSQFKDKYKNYINAVEDLKSEFDDGTKTSVDLLSNELNAIRDELLGASKSTPGDYGWPPSLKHLTHIDNEKKLDLENYLILNTQELIRNGILIQDEKRILDNNYIDYVTVDGENRNAKLTLIQNETQLFAWALGALALGLIITYKFKL
tara:strand:- start:767 stop:1258 length:492 start_codon:yes stop_codon:yes gene_type:complete